MSDMNKYLVEALGTFFFLSVILHSLSDSKLGPQAIAITLLAAIYFGASVSGAHFNPAVSFVMLLENKLTFSLFLAYVLSQLVGALAAWKFYELVFKNFKTF